MKRLKKDKLKVAMLLIGLMTLPTSVYALTINAQPYTTCGITKCSTCVDLAEFGLNKQRIDKIKAMDLTPFLPKFNLNISEVSYSWEGNSLCINGQIKPLSTAYWAIPIEANTTIDPWWNSTANLCKNMTLNESSGRARTNELTVAKLTSIDTGNGFAIVNSSCGNDGTEQPYNMVDRGATDANITFKLSISANEVKNWSVYYNFSSAYVHTNITDIVAFYWNISDLKDYSGNGYTLTNNNADCTKAGQRAGHNACNITGTTNSLTQSTLLDVNYTTFVIITNFNLYADFGSGGAYQNVWTKRSISTTDAFCLQLWNPTGQIYTRKWFGNVEKQAKTDATSWNKNTWFLLTATAGTTTQLLYLNATKQAVNDTNTQTIKSGTGEDFTIGQDLSYTAQYLRGRIDRVIVFNTSLSTAEMSSYSADSDIYVTLGGEETKPTTPGVVAGLVCFKTQPVCIRLSDNLLFKQVNNVII